MTLHLDLLPRQVRRRHRLLLFLVHKEDYPPRIPKGQGDKRFVIYKSNKGRMQRMPLHPLALEKALRRAFLALGYPVTEGDASLGDDMEEVVRIESVGARASRYDRHMQLKLNDQPTIWDGLGRADLLYEVATQVGKGTAPQVIAVTGDWGSGKTSFLRQLQIVLWPDLEDPAVRIATEELSGHIPVVSGRRPVMQLHHHLLNPGGSSDNRNPIVACPVIWFDAWKYQSEPAPVVALLHEIRNAFSSGQKFWRFISKNGRTAVEAALLSSESIAEAIGTKTPLVKGAGKFYEHFKKAKESGEAGSLSTELSTEKIDRLLTHDIGALLCGINYPSLLGDRPEANGAKLLYPGSERRLVIIIDDLDRCEPEMAVRMLEGIKVFLSIPNCVYVLGINEQRLIDHVATVQDGYSSDDSGQKSQCRHKAKDYLDKIINRQYPLGINRSRSILATSVFQGFEGTNWKCSKEEVEAVNAKIRTDMQDPYLLPPNPRKLKAFVGTLLRYEYVPFEKAPKPKMLFFFAYLAHFQPRMLRKISYYRAYREQFFQWVATGEGPFDELWPHPTHAVPSQDLLPKDPIDENVFHAHRIAKEIEAEIATLKVKFTTAYEGISANPGGAATSEIDPAAKDDFVETELQSVLRPYYLLA